MRELVVLQVFLKEVVSKAESLRIQVELPRGEDLSEVKTYQADGRAQRQGQGGQQLGGVGYTKCRAELRLERWAVFSYVGSLRPWEGAWASSSAIVQ